MISPDDIEVSIRGGASSPRGTRFDIEGGGQGMKKTVKQVERERWESWKDP